MEDDSVTINWLRPIHFNQLMSYVEEWEASGCYYGNREQFFKRHIEIKEFVLKLQEYSIKHESSKKREIRIPKLNGS